MTQGRLGSEELAIFLSKMNKIVHKFHKDSSPNCIAKLIIGNALFIVLMFISVFISVTISFYESYFFAGFFLVFGWIFVLICIITRYNMKYKKARLEAKLEADNLIAKERECFVFRGLRWVAPAEFPIWLELWNDFKGVPNPMIPNYNTNFNMPQMQNQYSGQNLYPNMYHANVYPNMNYQNPNSGAHTGRNQIQYSMQQGIPLQPNYVVNGQFTTNSQL